MMDLTAFRRMRTRTGNTAHHQNLVWYMKIQPHCQTNLISCPLGSCVVIHQVRIEV